MARLRRGGVGPLPASAYVVASEELIPPHLVHLEAIPGQCWSPESVVQCEQSAPDTLCRACSLRELGESWELLAARTNAGIPKAKFYRDLEREQAADDPEFAKWMARRRSDALTRG